jgi:hypothetical protein
MATLIHGKQKQAAAPPGEFALGLVVVGSLLCLMGLLLFVILSFDGAGPRTEGSRVPEGAYRETPAAAPATIAAQ